MNRKTLFTFLIIASCTIQLQAQVTIGSGSQPVAGALLQVKENDNMGANSKYGIGMPRVKLKSLTATGSNLATTIENAEQSPAWDPLTHTGLMVYHTDKCTFYGQGLYVWNGSQWQKIGDQILAGLNLSQKYIDLPSGKDARGAVVGTPLTISWDGSIAPTWTLEKFLLLRPIDFGGIPFVPSPSPLVSSPTTINLKPDAMTDAELQSNRWLSKGSTLLFNYSECGKKDTIKLNQTNYAIKVRNFFTNSVIALYPTSTPDALRVQANGEWKTTINDPYNILGAHTIPPTGGQELKETGATPTVSSYNVFVSSAPKQFSRATIKFKDKQSPQRFDSITVTVMQCGGKEDLSSIVNFDTSYGTNQVQKHQDQSYAVASAADKVKHIFYSADFGTAGRWMTTNLAAKRFDPLRSSGDGTIAEPLATTANSTMPTLPNVAWGYPRNELIGVGNSYPTENSVWFEPHPEIGLLYNWAAATNKKTATNDEGGSSVQARRQGICPSGWHLPSDLEWTELENVILAQTSKYSWTDIMGGSVTANTDPPIGLTVPLKSPCFVGLELSQEGTSKSVLEGGFSAYLTGYGATGSSTGSTLVAMNTRHRGYFWTSSSAPVQNSTSNAYYRSHSSGFYEGTTGTYARGNNFGRSVLLSVRCKKD